MVGRQIRPLLAADVAQACAILAAQRARIHEGNDRIAQLHLDVDSVALADDEQVLDLLVILGGGQGGRVGLEVDLPLETS